MSWVHRRSTSFLKTSRLCRLCKSERKCVCIALRKFNVSTEDEKHKNPIGTKDSSQSHSNERISVKRSTGPLLSQPFPVSSDKSFQLQIRLSPSGGQTLEISVDKVSFATVDIERASVRRISQLRVVDVPNLAGLLSLSDVSLAVEVECCFCRFGVCVCVCVCVCVRARVSACFL